MWRRIWGAFSVDVFDLQTLTKPPFTWPSRTVSHCFVSFRYFKAAVEYFQRQFAGDKLLVIAATDDYRWSKSKLSELENNNVSIHVMVNQTREIDMCILTMTEHIIMSHGVRCFCGLVSFLRLEKSSKSTAHNSVTRHIFLVDCLPHNDASETTQQCYCDVFQQLAAQRQSNRGDDEQNRFLPSRLGAIAIENHVLLWSSHQYGCDHPPPPVSFCLCVLSKGGLKCNIQVPGVMTTTLV